ncbi:hypothetical protein ACQEU3_20430 [Spirillospora sp. CA-253888]
MGITSQLWEAGAGIYDRIRSHPFLQGLTSGAPATTCASTPAP